MTTQEIKAKYKEFKQKYALLNKFFDNPPAEIVELGQEIKELHKVLTSKQTPKEQSTSSNQELDNWLGKITESINTLLSQKYATQLAAHDGLGDKLNNTLTAIS